MNFKTFIKPVAAFALICGAPLLQAQVLGGGATGGLGGNLGGTLGNGMGSIGGNGQAAWAARSAAASITATCCVVTPRARLIVPTRPVAGFATVLRGPAMRSPAPRRRPPRRRLRRRRAR